MAEDRKPASLVATQHGGKHYKKLVIEPAYYNHVNSFRFCPAEAIKYLSRYADRGGKDDVKKALHYCQMILEFDYQVQTTVTYSDDPATPLPPSDSFVSQRLFELRCGDCVVQFTVGFPTAFRDLVPANGLNPAAEVRSILRGRLLEEFGPVVDRLLNELVKSDEAPGS